MEATFPVRREEAHRFLSLLFDGLPQDLVVSLFVLPGAHSLQIPVDRLDEAAHEAVQASLEPGTNVYVGCCPLTSAPRPGRGTAADVAAFSGVWVDLDISGPAHRSNALPPDQEAVFDLLDKMDVPPTAIVDSGWGLYAWWLLDAARPLRDVEAKHKAHQLVRGAQEAIRRLAGGYGWTVDPTDDLSRVLRLPGTMNWKIEGEPRVVRLFAPLGPRYSLTELWGRWAHLVPDEREGPAPPLPELVTAGHRTRFITSVAGRFLKMNLSLDAALGAAETENRLRCSPPLDERKVRESVRGIYKRYPPGETPGLNGHRPMRVEIIRGPDLWGLEMPQIECLPVLGVDGFIMKQAANLLYAYPKAGKTELMASLVREWIADGQRILYFTEEPPQFWLPRLQLRGDREFWDLISFCPAFGWDLKTSLEVIEHQEFDVLVTDTLRNTMGYQEHKGDEDVTRVVVPVIQATRAQGATFVASYHARKMPGEGGQDISGHHALYGAFDRAIQLRTLGGDENERKRRLVVSGRMLDPNQPQKLVYRLVNAGQLEAEGKPLQTAGQLCEWCGREFPALRKDARFCSDTCRKRSTRSPGEGP